MFRLISRPASLLAFALSAVALLACGESSQEKAKAEVCSARSEISKQVAKLQGLTISTSLLTEAKTSLEAIEASVKKIKSATPNLEPPVKEQVEAGNKAFDSEMVSIGAGIATATKAGGSLQSELKNAGPQVEAALTSLANTYKLAYGSLKC